jgi:hypothetical protein
MAEAQAHHGQAHFAAVSNLTASVKELFRQCWEELSDLGSFLGAIRRRCSTIVKCCNADKGWDVEERPCAQHRAWAIEQSKEAQACYGQNLFPTGSGLPALVKATLQAMIGQVSGLGGLAQAAQ